jgi:ribonucleoside-diphosphate reductase alpha chain
MAFNFSRDAESLRNACTEVVSEDDSDKCNLGTVWMNRCKDKEEFKDVVKFGTLFLLCGGIYSDVPTDKIKEVGLKNNRIGLGLGGIHEWLMFRGYKYQCVPELHQWLATYERESDAAAFVGAKQLVLLLKLLLELNLCSVKLISVVITKTVSGCINMWSMVL